MSCYPMGFDPEIMDRALNGDEAECSCGNVDSCENVSRCSNAFIPPAFAGDLQKCSRRICPDCSVKVGTSEDLVCPQCEEQTRRFFAKHDPGVLDVTESLAA